MGFWGLFGKTVKTGDAFFGEMVFIELSKNPAQRYFRPSGEMIDLNVTASLSGPTQRQKDFFNQIETDYFLLVSRWARLIEQEFGAWMPLPLRKDFMKEFKPTYLTIPTLDQLPIEWEIAFDTIHDLNHSVMVEMLGYEPQYVRVDG